MAATKVAQVMTDDLFGAPPLPPGFLYRPEVLSTAEEEQVLARMAELPFQEFEFHGFLGKRRVVSYGWKYDFAAAALRKAEPLPDFLLPVGGRAAAASTTRKRLRPTWAGVGRNCSGGAGCASVVPPGGGASAGMRHSMETDVVPQ
jgi:hypothetical protein